jgi:hypothetical protein
MSACHISADVYRRLWLLYLMEQFSEACYGRVRLQKVAYFAAKSSRLKPFTFKKAPYGQFSEELGDTLEQLTSMHLVTAEPLGKGGNRYRATVSPEGAHTHAEWLEAVDPSAKAPIDRAVADYGYRDQQALIDTAHEEPGFAEASLFDVLLQANIPGSIPVQLSDEQCEELALSVSPAFLDVLRSLAETDWRTSLSKVRLIEAR